jgi:uncharacterized protein (TIGR00255 family)
MIFSLWMPNLRKKKMIRSMTGYSSVHSEEADFSLSMSLKSTNHRFLDVQVRTPGALEPLEPLLRRLVKDDIARGHVEVTLTLEWAACGELHLDRRLLAAYAAACRQLRDDFGMIADPDPVALLRIPGMVAGNGLEVSSAELERLQQTLERVTKEALRRLNQMRAREGETLERDLRARLEKLEELGENVHRLAQSASSEFQRRLEKRVKDMLGNIELDASRLAQEVVFLASRADIAEEVTRFRSHVGQARRLLEESSEVGKKLDFLLQEMNREANTLLSKTTDVPEVGLEIAGQAIEMKAEIEKLREQAQNIE